MIEPVFLQRPENSVQNKKNNNNNNNKNNKNNIERGNQEKDKNNKIYHEMVNLNNNKIETGNRTARTKTIRYTMEWYILIMGFTSRKSE